MSRNTAILMFSAWAATVAAQQLSVVPPSDLAAQRKLVEQTWQEWEASDADLERSLLTAPVNRVLTIIERGRRYAIAYHEQRAKFLEAITSSLQRELSVLERDDQERTPVEPDPRKLDILLKAQSSLSSRVRGTDLNPVEKVALEEQSALIRQLTENIAAQQALYSAYKENQERNRKVRQALVESYRSLIQLLGEQRRLNEDKRELWLQYYDALRELVEARRSAVAEPKGRRTAQPVK